MHALQEAAIDALRGWDAEAMGNALTDAMDLVLAKKHSKSVRRHCIRECQTFLDGALGYPRLNKTFGAGTITWLLELSATFPEETRRKASILALSFRVELSPKTLTDDPVLGARWTKLGFRSTATTLPRSEVRPPRPFDGEPTAPAERPFDAATSRTKLAKLSPKARAGLLATYCARFVALYEAEGEPSSAPEDAVACLVARSIGKASSATAAGCMTELAELLEIFGAREDLLLVHALATFEYALRATDPKTKEATQVRETTRALQAGIEAVDQLAYHRGGTDAWAYAERLWITRAIVAIGEAGAKVDVANAVAPTIPVWKRELDAK